MPPRKTGMNLQCHHFSALNHRERFKTNDILNFYAQVRQSAGVLLHWQHVARLEHFSKQSLRLRHPQLRPSVLSAQSGSAEIVEQVASECALDVVAHLAAFACAVQLGWTKLGVHTPTVHGRVRTLSSQSRTSQSKGNSTAGSSGSSTPGSPRPPPSPRKDSERPILPPDAVDLVVEDPHTAQAENSHDWRKGEPAGLRKVYRRGYAVEHADHREEVEVEVRSPHSPFAVGEADDIDDATRTEGQAVEEMRVTRARTPPAHARIVVEQYPDTDEVNPWAS